MNRLKPLLETILWKDETCPPFEKQNDNENYEEITGNNDATSEEEKVNFLERTNHIITENTV